MPAPRVLLALAAAALVALALSLGISAAQESGPAPQVGYAEWVEHPSDVGDLEQGATAVVEAEVTAVEPGPALVDPADGTDPDEAIPTQRIGFSTIQVLDGQAPQSFKLFKTGSEELYLRNDPFYRTGERYVLFIRPREGEPGTYLPVAPDGRLRVQDGEAQAFINTPPANQLDGLTPQQIDAEISG